MLCPGIPMWLMGRPDALPAINKWLHVDPRPPAPRCTTSLLYPHRTAASANSNESTALHMQSCTRMAMFGWGAWALQTFTVP
jgi:hypothetical protein